MHLCTMMKQSLEIKRRAHYYVQEPLNNAKHMLFVIHGYAQLAKDFIQEFEYLKNESVLVVAPEAISKFYNKEQKAVANWMTSHERLDEIEDYVGFLNLVYQEVETRYKNLSFSVLGFSQGVSTALRWVCQSTLKPKSFFACSGSIPPELQTADFEYLSETRFYYYYGSRDKLLLPPKAIIQADLLAEFKKGLLIRVYDGRHEVSSLTHQDILNSI